MPSPEFKSPEVTPCTPSLEEKYTSYFTEFILGLKVFEQGIKRYEKLEQSTLRRRILFGWRALVGGPIDGLETDRKILADEYARLQSTFEQRLAHFTHGHTESELAPYAERIKYSKNQLEIARSTLEELGILEHVTS